MRNLSFDIKPVRIRFAFGKNECATLEQLQLNFSPKAIYENFPQLLKWLEQNHNKDIKDQLVEKQGEICQSRDAESLFLLYSIFFQKMFEERKINALSDLCFNWYNNSERNTKSYKYLCKEINTRKWGSSFFLDVSSRLITKDKQKTSQTNIFDSYNVFCGECDFFIKNNINDIFDLYISLSFDKELLPAFDFLDKEVRKYEWKNEFFLNIIPRLYNISLEDKELPIIKRGKFKFPFDSKEGLYSLYYFFLHDLCDEKGIHDLQGIYIYLLFDSDSTNCIDIHNKITKCKWHVPFFSTLIKELIDFHHHDHNNNNNHYDIKKIGLSDDSSEDLYNLYHYFLDSFLESRCIDNLEDLYFWWHIKNNSGFRDCYTNLHEEIVDTKWGNEFLNGIVKRLMVEYNESINPNEARPMHLMDEKDSFAFFKKYFGYYLESHKINNISTLYLYWSKDDKYKKCFDCLESILYNNMWGVEKMLELYKTNIDYFDKEHWLSIFHQLIELHNRNLPENSDKWKNLYKIAKIYIEDFCKFKEGYEILLGLEKMGDDKVSSYLKQQRDKESKINKDFIKKYTQREKNDWFDYPDGHIYYESSESLKSVANTLHEKWILNTQELIHRLLSYGDTWKKLIVVVDYMRELDDKTKKTDPVFQMGYGIDGSYRIFFDAFVNKDIGDRDGYERLVAVSKYNGLSFLEIRFVYALIGLNHYGNKTRRGAMDILNSIKEIYPVAAYLLKNRSLPNYVKGGGTPDLSKLINGGSDRDILNYALKIYCMNMVYYI